MRLALCKWLALVSFVLFIGFTQFANPVVAATSNPAPALIDDAAQAITEDTVKLAEPGLRGQHPKGHGVVWAKFSVEPSSLSALI
jgi:hypothetical protein